MVILGLIPVDGAHWIVFILVCCCKKKPLLSSVEYCLWDSVYKRLLEANWTHPPPATDSGQTARDRRALQQLALNVHIKHSYWT